MYSPKIRDDLIPKIYRKAKLQNKPMTNYVNDILSSILVEENNDNAIYVCCSCRAEVTSVEGNKGYCDFCESVVFVEKF